MNANIAIKTDQCGAVDIAINCKADDSQTEKYILLLSFFTPFTAKNARNGSGGKQSLLAIKK